MKQILLILILFLFFYSEKSFAQFSEKDSVLYLLFDRDKYDYYEWKGKDQITKEPNPERASYGYPNEPGVYNGHSLEFLSYKKGRSDTVAINILDHVPVVTIEQLAEFTGLRGAKYLNKLKNIYLVEKFPDKGVASITKVRLDIIIE